MPIKGVDTTNRTRFGRVGFLIAVLSVIMLFGTTTVASAQNAGTTTEDQRLEPDGAQTGGQFGTAVAQDGDTMIVGAPEQGSGAAYVFTRTGDTWTEQQKLVGSDSALGDLFGTAVVIEGDTLVIGASFADAAYVFTRTGDTWTEQQKLIPSDLESFGSFGDSLALEDDTLVIGASFADAAYVFSRTNDLWSESQRLFRTGFFTNFGFSVAIQGDIILVGEATGTDVFGINTGAVHIFERQGAQWLAQQVLTPSDGESFGLFGVSVAIDGDTLVVGAAFGDSGRTIEGDEGVVYIYTRTGDTWTEQQRLVASDGEFFEVFGWATAIDGDTLVVGAISDGNIDNPIELGLSGPGAAYVFTRTGNTWTEQQKLVASDGELEDSFGGSVVLDDRMVIVGTGISDTFTFALGTNAVYLFNLPTTFAGQGPVALCNGEPVTVNLALGDVATDGDDVILGTAGPDTINAGAGNDVICALGGDDIINAGNGADIILGGNGNDTINAGQGRDFIEAGAGNDFVSGGKGKDTINGGDGDDDLRGNEGTDTINGGVGDDELRGGQKADVIFGDNGDDNLVGGTRPDILDGGFGTDEYNGGGGVDTCIEDPIGRVETTVRCELFTA